MTFECKAIFDIFDDKTNMLLR